MKPVTCKNCLQPITDNIWELGPRHRGCVGKSTPHRKNIVPVNRDEYKRHYRRRKAMEKRES